MLDANMQGQLKQYLANLREPIELVATLDEGEKSAQTRELLSEIADADDVKTGGAGVRPIKARDDMLVQVRDFAQQFARLRAFL
ncbi:MAG: hypothetical protein AAFN48_12805, partial [Pseudomonadota bacterium]